jgi:flagellar assembly protein FliH
MLSRLVGDEEAGIAPLAWPSCVRAAGSFAEPALPAGPTPEQIDAMLQQQARQSHQTGYREGEAAGRKLAEEQMREAVARLAAAAAEAAGTRPEALRRAETDIVRLSIEIARRILHRELTLDASALQGLIRAALEKLGSEEVYRVRVHPDLRPPMRACLEQIGRDSAIEVIADPLQPRGGAVFEFSRGHLDASVETQLHEIELGLADVLENRT